MITTIKDVDGDPLILNHRYIESVVHGVDYNLESVTTITMASGEKHSTRLPVSGVQHYIEVEEEE